MNEVTRVRVMMAIAAIVLLASGLFVLLAEGVNLWSMVMFLTVVAIAVVALVLVARVLRDLRSGIPLQDERSKALNARVGYYSFYLSMYLTLALAVAFTVLEDRDMTVPNSELLFIVVVIMGSIHIVLSTYFTPRRGRGSSS